MAGGPTGMTMERLIGVEVYLRLENNSDFVESEDEDGRIRVLVTGVDSSLGLWVLNARYSVREHHDYVYKPAHVLIPFRSVLSIAMVDKTLVVEETGAASLEEAMTSSGSTKEDLERMAADHINCSRQSFRNAKYAGANFKGIVMRETDLDRSDLRNVNFTGADLKDATLREVLAEGANFSNAYLWEAVLEGGVFNRAIFKGANLYLANLRGASLAGADLEGANLVETRLTDAKLTGANLEGVKLLRAQIGRLQATDKEWKALGNSLKREGKDYFSNSYLSEARWCLEKAISFFQQAKDNISASEVKKILEDVEEEEKLSLAMQKERPERG